MTQITRRDALRAGAGLLAAPAIIQAANARSQILIQNQREFEELTGIRVGSEAIPEQQHRQKFVIEFASGRPSFDVIGISLHVNKRQVGRARWTTDLKPMLADPTRTSPDFDFQDFGAGAVAYSTQADGRMDTIPEFTDYFILYYNKEIFQRANVQVPRTYDELYETARRLTD